jgi:pseudomonalisin
VRRPRPAGLLAGLALLLPLPPVSAAGASRSRSAPVAGVAAEIRDAEDLGRVDADRRLERMVLVLPLRDPEGLESLLSSLQDPSSARFRRWLAPAEFGGRFGATSSDVSALARWLREQGFFVEGATAGRTALVFSGRAGDVERAFDTEFHEFRRDGVRRVANVRPLTFPGEPGLPRVRGLLPVHGFARREPLVRTPGAHFNGNRGLGLAPADFAVLYGLDRAYPAGRGAGQRIAIVARTNIRMADNRSFRAFFGLSPRDPLVLLNGEDPGIRFSDLALLETNLDIEWSGGLAPEADVVVIVSKSTETTDGIDLSCLYAVDENVAGIVEVSYGLCEPRMAAEEISFYTNLWAQAAAQGITVFVSSGDSGAAGCEPGTWARGTRAAVNGLGSSPHVTSVGGTQLDDGGRGDLYWSPDNDPETMRSILGPIPEVAWNESGTVPGGAALLASGGGASLVHGRPVWQSLPGVPDGTQRLLPDVAVNAGGRVPYYIVTPGFGLYPVYGTSATAPAFAGIAALLNERAGGRLGNLNPTLYALGRRQFAEQGRPVFRDVTSGDNSVPGVPGFAAGPGYDAVTGLGSPDVAALADAIQDLTSPPPTADFAFPTDRRAGRPVPFTDVSTGSPASWSWDFGDGETSSVQNPVHTFGQGTYSVSLTVSNPRGSSTRTQTVDVTWPVPEACTADEFTLCLVDGRYRVTSGWKDQYAGGAEASLFGAPLTDATGAFWLSDAERYEYLIRINTSTDNGRAWIAIPTFTDVEFRIAVFDTATGQYREYHSPAGNRTLVYDPYFFVFP